MTLISARQSDVGNARNKRRALIDESRGVTGDLRDGAAQLWGCGLCREHFDARAMRAENLQRQVNAIEPEIILPAILKMVDYLQRGAERSDAGHSDRLSPCASRTKRPTGIADRRQ